MPMPFEQEYVDKIIKPRLLDLIATIDKYPTKESLRSGFQRMYNLPRLTMDRFDRWLDLAQVTFRRVTVLEGQGTKQLWSTPQALGYAPTPPKRAQTKVIHDTELMGEEPPGQKYPSAPQHDADQDVKFTQPPADEVIDPDEGKQGGPLPGGIRRPRYM